MRLKISESFRNLRIHKKYLGNIFGIPKKLLRWYAGNTKRPWKWKSSPKEYRIYISSDDDQWRAVGKLFSKALSHLDTIYYPLPTPCQIFSKISIFLEKIKSKKSFLFINNYKLF